MNKIKGNNGVIIASNEVVLDTSISDTYSFENVGFATGMAFSINNTYHTWNNTRFNIQYLNSNILNVSYQGPFWGTLDDSCNVSPFVTIAFDLGFGQIGCTSATGGTGGTGLMILSGQDTDPVIADKLKEQLNREESQN